MTSIWLDVGLRTIRDKKNPPTDVLYKEMEDFLQSFEHAEKVIRRIPPTSFARLGTYRSQLLYFGYFTDKVNSFFEIARGRGTKYLHGIYTVRGRLCIICWESILILERTGMAFI